MPSNNKVTRKLRAILSADVKGYSLLMADDEVHTIQTLKTYRSLMSDLIQQHSGHVVDNPGDNLLAEFESAVDAVECAVQIQMRLKKENVKFVNDKRLQFRIGVNIGDVVYEEGRIYGSGVNVAARIEGLSDPGGICISRNTYDHVKDKLEYCFAYLGEHEVKNIKEPIRVYRVLAYTDAPNPLVEEKLELPDKPSIAVLPFTNMSGDPEQEYFSDGITEDIIIALSRSPWMFVIARNSSFSYRGMAVDAKTISKELGVRYVLEGSVRKASNHIRVNAQLINGINGHHVWAEKYDGELKDIFDFQDEITQKVVASTQTQIQMSFGKYTVKKRQQDLQTWDLIARAWKQAYRLNEEGWTSCEELSREAITKDPNSGMANFMLASAICHSVLMGFVPPDKAKTKLNESYEVALHAVSIDENNEYAHWILGIIQLNRMKHDLAVSELQRAIEINPNCSLAYGSLGTALAFSGDPEESIRYSEIALRINPRDTSIFFRYSGIAMAHFVANRFDDAIEWSQKSIQRKPIWRTGHLVLISSLAYLDRLDHANQAAKAFLKIYPNASISVLKMMPFKYEKDASMLKEGLRKAGLPE